MTNQETKIQEFIQNFKFDKNLILYWLPWRWKTHILRKLFEKLPKNEWSLEKYMIDDWEFREQITSWNMTLKPKDSVWISITNFPLEMCIRVKVLFFDDIGSSENVSDAQKTKLKFILDERDKKKLVTIFTTNLNPKELSDLYGERIKSRIFNAKNKNGLLMVEITWEDRRKENIEKLSL